MQRGGHGDERDDDGDGLTDCEDDDCWGAACGVEMSRVRTGAMHVVRVTDGTPRRAYSGERVDWRAADDTVIAADLNAVEGTAWTQVGGGNHDDRCVAGPCVIFIVSQGAQTYHPKTADGEDVPAQPG